MARVLVTGAADFIGSHGADHCVGLGFDVVGVDDFSGGYLGTITKGRALLRGYVDYFRKRFGPPCLEGGRA